MKKKRWLIVAIFVIVVAALAAGAYLWFGRSTTATVHYLTAKVTKGTISQTVSADFTLSSANGTTSVALGGGAASDSSASSSASSSSTGTSATTSLHTTSSPASSAVLVSSHSGGSATATTYAVLTTSSSATTLYAGDGLPSASGASGSPSPSSSPTTTATPTPTPTPSPSPTQTRSPIPSPSPSATGVDPSGGGSGGSGASGSSSGSATGTSSGSTNSSSSSSSSTVSGVVTRLVQPAGATPRTLQRLLFVSGKPVFAFVSATPLWKNLSTSLASGAQRVNVATLQKALKEQGYYKKAINGRFTSATKKALKRWQKANGLSATGVVDVTRFVWMPTGSVLTAWNVSLGSHVSSGTALASVVSPSRLSASALISQADIADLKVGQKAQMTIDGYDSDAFTGRITFISSEPASSSASSSSTQYAITVTSDDLPELAKSGMTGTLDIVIEQAADVLMVPTTAVSGSSSTSFVRVMQDGKPVFRQVQTGMATSSYTEVTSGLAVGETVVTGQYTDGANSSGSSSSQSTRSGGGLLQSGGAFPAGGPPAGGGFPGGGQSGGGTQGGGQSGGGQ
jgi:hypothetical protein